MKQEKLWECIAERFAWRGIFVAMAVFALASCGVDDKEEEPPFTTDPVEWEFSDIAVKCFVDADSPEVVEADLQANLPIPDGCGYKMNFYDRVVYVSDVDSREVISVGEFDIKNVSAEDVRHDAYSQLLSEEKHLEGFQKWTFTFEADSRYYDAFYVLDGVWGYICLCEDLTEYYQQKFPDAGIRAAARYQKLNFGIVMEWANLGILKK